jgi:hypothetical protein
MHTVEAQWREANVNVLLERVHAIDDWLEHTIDLEELFEEDERLSTQLRSLAALLRSRRNDISSEAETLRAKLADQRSKREIFDNGE